MLFRASTLHQWWGPLRTVGGRICCWEQFNGPLDTLNHSWSPRVPGSSAKPSPRATVNTP